MAFHPFQFFRKRQKSFLAVLTIFVMFIFILSYGKGDAFEWAMAMIGARDRKDKTEVTKLYNKTVTVGDLEQVRRNRQAASAFVMAALTAQEPNISALEQRDLMTRLFTAMQGPGGPAAARQRMRALQESLAKEGKTDAARYIASFNRNMALGGWQQAHPGELYFGGTRSVDDLLDFLLWKKQADKLNVTLTDADVRRLVNQETDTDALTGNELRDTERIRSVPLGLMRNFTPKDLYAALREEFRVRLAQQALLGSTPGARAVLSAGLAGSDLPAGATPEQFWDYYKGHQTKLDVGFVKVPVSQFIDQVKEEPTDKELRELFEKYKNAEPGPEREQPGFKVPRRVKVEWVSANPDNAYYQKKAGEALVDLSVGRLFLAAGAGAHPLAAATRLAAATTPDLPLLIQYEAYVKGEKSWWDAMILPPASPTGKPEGEGPYAVGLQRPDTVAAVLGELFGAAATGAAPWAAPAALQGATDVRLAEQRARVAAIALAGADPVLPGVIAREAALATVPVQPLSAVREVMAERARARVAPDLAQGALDTFTKELKAKRFNPKEAAEYVAKNANPEHGITDHRAMTEAKGATDVVTDPDVAPLKAAREQLVPMTPQESKQFADALLKPTQTYDPERLGSVGGPTYYFWLSENDKTYVPTFDAARPKVLAAWKFNKARELAHKAAEQVVASLKDRPQGTDTERFLRDEAARRGYEWFTPFPAVSKLEEVKNPLIMQTAGTEYQPYRFKDADFPYPRPDAVDKLFESLKQPDDATVLRDRPDRTYYVAVLLKKPVVPGEKEFFDIYQRAPRGFLADPLWSMFQAQRDEQYRTALVQHFRVESQAPLDEDGTYKMDPDVRKRLAVGRSDNEE